MGATQASAGMLAPFNEALDGGPLLDLASRSLDLYDSFVARVVHDSGVALNYHRSGTLEVAMSSAAAARLRQAQATLERRGVATEWLTGDVLRTREPALSSEVTG